MGPMLIGFFDFSESTTVLEGVPKEVSVIESSPVIVTFGSLRVFFAAFFGVPPESGFFFACFPIFLVVASLQEESESDPEEEEEEEEEEDESAEESESDEIVIVDLVAIPLITSITGTCQWPDSSFWMS